MRNVDFRSTNIRERILEYEKKLRELKRREKEATENKNTKELICIIGERRKLEKNIKILRKKIAYFNREYRSFKECAVRSGTGGKYKASAR